MRILNSLMVAGFCCTAFSAWADASGEATWRVKGKVRGDSVQSSTNTKTGESDAVTTSTSQIKLQRAQFEIIGAKGPAEIKIKYYADKDYLKYGLLAYKFSDMVTVSAGKLDPREFSLEWDYGTTDEYLLGRAGAYGIDNVPGAEVKVTTGDHSFFVQVLQGSSSIVDETDSNLKMTAITTDRNSGGLSTMLQYRGDFMDHMIRPIFSYGMIRTANSNFTITKNGTTTAYNYGNGYQNHMGSGVKVVVAGSTTDLEYDTVTTLKQKDVDASTATNVGDLSIQTRLPAMASFTPIIKLLTDTDKKGADNNVGDVSRTAFMLGTEYALLPSIRIHAVYSMDNTTTKVLSNKVVVDKKAVASIINMGVTASM